ncbi:MAG: energy-coupled thiamine transporter ThiT [Clostridia bacterium]|nr:energy-coupled thiamine transporter ThiT [Clostridia bacterium]
MKQSRQHIHTLCESAILVALAVALSLVSKYTIGVWLTPLLPFGGTVTFFSMLPICIISIKHGLGWGLGSAFCFSWFQILEGGVFGWGLTPVMLIGSLLLDYILAFTVLGLAGIFRKYGTKGMISGVVLVCVLRFVIHFLAGIILWAELDEFIAFGQAWVNRPVLYSIVYNGSYMLPETILTIVGAILLFRVPQIRKILKMQNITAENTENA